MRRIGIVCGPVDGNRQGAGTQVALGVCEGPSMGVEDVGVEDVQRIENQRAGDPGDVPDRELSVSVIDSADAPQSKRERIGHDDRQAAESEGDERHLPPAAPPR